YSKMAHYVDIAPMEVGWLGTVIQKGRNFLITDVFLFKQEVNHSSTEIDEEGLAEFTMEVLDKHGDTNGLEILNNLRFWGHSHVNMDTVASGQDEKQMGVFAGGDAPWFIRGIFNKQGKASFALYHYDHGYRITELPWMIYEPVMDDFRAGIEQEFFDKVTVSKPPPPPVYVPSRGSRIVVGTKEGLENQFTEEDFEHDHSGPGSLRNPITPPGKPPVVARVTKQQKRRAGGRG
ncbi:MAG: hypothetical protein ACAH35_05115, partial [Candidatus Paceibacterota bacterium]